MSVQIISACRSAVVPRGGAFAALSLHDLGAPVLQAAMAQAGLVAAQVDEVIVSNALGGGGNPARLVALAAGLPQRIAGLSIDRQCAGGLDSLLLARQMILSGAADVVIAGGVESYSRRPLRLVTFADGRQPEAYDHPPFSPWPDRDPDMAQAADQLAQSEGTTREMQDSWAIDSHQKARNAAFGNGEIIPLGDVQTDSFTRNLTPALCARAAAISGSVTAANTSVAADAAAFCVVVSDRMATQLGRSGPTILGGATCGSAPESPGIAPIAAIKAALKQTNLAPNDIDIAEVMEAYAVQAIACVQGAGLKPDRVNLGGGSLARGHPIGVSGTINGVRLYHELERRGCGTGMATIAAAGGIATALVLRA
ncbi:acetyl-CoA C-acyltransferase [Sulfitobacter sp. SK012]|uniref:thiolase family protein n=1 Tax=Sulfitobacter sp. SK012 TaxID=1389005 RepID=UPI000E0B8B89|nr:thiolase family protein [Sulfitobacter sp. SK012]AXI44977.1 acetyl-CoA C-acyltransferase [Sulfitobacter sp. SK012]